MSLAAVFPRQRESVLFEIPGFGIRSGLDLFNDGHGFLKKEIALRQREHFGRLTLQEFAVGAHFVSFRIDFDLH